MPDALDRSRTLRPSVHGLPRVMCCHMATLTGLFPPNSLPAVRECVAARVPRLEIDLRFLADDSMLVFHDAQLERDSTGSGPVESRIRQDLAGVRFRGNPEVTLSFLDDIVEWLQGSTTILQVDLKLRRPITPRRVQILAEALRPLGPNLIVGSQAHWNLRPLAAAGLPVAFDPTLQWHAPFPNAPRGTMPANLGVHGLRDDAPIARLALASATEYVETRVLDLLGLLPHAVEWMVDYRTLLQIERLGIRLGDRLASAGVALAAWTVADEGEALSGPLLDQLFRIGATAVITDHADALAAYAARL